MHSTNLPPAGKGLILESLPDGEYVKSKIVEPTAMKLTAEGVYQGYSVGISRPRIVRDNRARGGRIVDGKIVELSVVDRPANSMAKFTLAKAAKDGSVRFIGKSVLVPAEYAPPPEPITRYRKGTHVTVFATNSAGEEQAYEGIVTRTGVNAVELDQDGYTDEGGVARLSSLDITGAYKGSVPDLTKRDFDPGVGGGVDRDKLPSKAFADPKRRKFPIVSPKDVADAARLAGHAADPDAVRSRIKEIARDKGPEFEARLPDTLKDDADKGTNTEDSVANAQTLDKEAFPGAAPPFGSAGEADKAADGTCPTCKGAGKLRDGNLTCPDCGGSGKAAAEKAADGACVKCKGAGMFDGSKCDKCKGTGKAFVIDQPPAAAKGADMSSILEDADGIKEDVKDLEDDLEDVSGQKADEDGKDGDKDPDDDGDDDSSDSGDDDSDAKGSGPDFPKGIRVERRDAAWVVAKGAEVLGTHGSREAAEAHKDALKREKRANKAAKRALKVATADAKKRAVADDEDIPWLLRRAHDFTCGAYKTADVVEFYPSIEKNGVIAAISPAARGAIYGALVNEVGAGTSPERIVALGKALRGVSDFLDASQVGGDAAAALALAARDELHEAFKAENPILGAGGDPTAGIPKPSEDGVEPGKYKRPYISAGHQREDASASPAHIPQVTHPISASDFSRGPLTDGHQRYLTGKLADIHDGLADWKPELCRMSTMGADGTFGPDRQAANPLVSQLSNGTTNAPMSITLTGSNGGSFTYGGVPTTGGPVAKALTSDDIAAAITKAIAPFQQKIDSLQQAYDALASQPDPGQAPIRGIAGATVTKVEKASAANEAQQQAARGRRAARIDYLQAVARGGNADARLAAQERLAKMGVEITE